MTFACARVAGAVLVAVVLLRTTPAATQGLDYARTPPVATRSDSQATESKGYLKHPSHPYSQPGRTFLHRDNWLGYDNYGVEAYETYTVSSQSLQIYDRIGENVLRGYPLARWEENRSKDVDAQSSEIERSQQHWQWFDNLIVARDSFAGWRFGLLSGDKIRTTLTPLTLHQPRWEGLRIDGDSDRHGFTLLITRGQQRRFSSYQPGDEINPVVQFGGRWHTDVTPWLTVGGTAYNQHIADLKSNRGSLTQGTVPTGMQPPSRIYVRVGDDSPRDAAAVRVYDVDIYVQVHDADGTRRWLTTRADAAEPARFDPSILRSVVEGRRVGDHYEAVGAEVVDVEFVLPEGLVPERARFEAVVAGDYRIGVRQTQQHFNQDAPRPAWEERQWPARPIPNLHNQDGFPGFPIDFKPDQSAAFYTVARASGNPDNGRLRTVAFDYGLPVGQSLVGADFEIVSQQLLARGEVVFNDQGYQFPFQSDSLGVSGGRFDRDAVAAYLTLERTFDRAFLGTRESTLGLEAFRIDPDYSGGCDSRRGGAVLFTDNGGDFELQGRTRVFSGFTQEFELVTDNDDNDDWADDSPFETGNFQPLQPQVYSGAKAHSGVYPGLDDDGDNTPDSDRNRNGVADWSEPFLFYASDPQEFTYGIDFNNNGVPDFRENDAEPDYPYRRDQRGLHAFVGVAEPLPLIERITVGLYSLSQIAAAGEADGFYARLRHRSSWRGTRIEFDDDIKRVRDTIPDDVYRFDIGPGARNSGSVLNPPPPDPLDFRNSLVNTAFLRLSRHFGRAVRADTRLLHSYNRQGARTFDDSTRQAADTVTRMTAIGRAEVDASFLGLDLWAGIKAQAIEARRSSLDAAEMSSRFLAPAVRVVQPFTSNFSFRGGVSGVSFLPLRYIDNVDESNSYKQWSTVLSVDSRVDDYLGYTVWTSVGVQWDRVDYDRGDRGTDSDTFGFFVESFAGF